MKLFLHAMLRTYAKSFFAAASLLALPHLSAQEQLTLTDVQTIFSQAVSRAREISPRAVIAVTDREGFVLGVWSVSGVQPSSFQTIEDVVTLSVNGTTVSTGLSVPASDPRVGLVGLSSGAAIREAGTAAFLSSNNNAFNSRVAQFIIQQNFPPGVGNRPPGPLVGVEFSNGVLTDVNRFKGNLSEPGNGWVIDQNTNLVRPRNIRTPFNPGGTDADALGGKPLSLIKGGGVAGVNSRIILADVPFNTRLSGRCSSVPLFKNGQLVGGIGVFPRPEPEAVLEPFDLELRNQPAGAVAEEEVALAGQIGFAPPVSVQSDQLTNDGIRFPYVAGVARQAGTVTPFAQLPGAVDVMFPLRASPPLFPFPRENFSGNQVAGEVRFPIRADPNPGLIRGQPRLNQGEVRQIIAQAGLRAAQTRAAIRLPIGQPMQCWIVVIGNPNLDPSIPSNDVRRIPPILGIYRTPDAPFFSFDVAAQKARTALFFSSDSIAQSSRTVGFLAQDAYPPGLNNLGPGPYGPAVRLNGQPSFNGLQIQFTFPFPFGFAPNFNVPNGITIFPGGFPLYRNGVLVGAIGISGDGVDQDDIAGVAGSLNFDPAPNIRADFFTFGGARLPYAKFPRNADNEIN
ncbi:MAG: heme-binding protein [Verrucomicrobia bacterium]|nr:heme-binding protein [Verrucomicrobiota bacterium]